MSSVKMPLDCVGNDMTWGTDKRCLSGYILLWPYTTLAPQCEHNVPSQQEMGRADKEVYCVKTVGRGGERVVRAEDMCASAPLLWAYPCSPQTRAFSSNSTVIGLASATGYRRIYPLPVFPLSAECENMCVSMCVSMCVFICVWVGVCLYACVSLIVRIISPVLSSEIVMLLWYS